MFQIQDTQEGYVVSCFCKIAKDEYWEHWHPVMNFGDGQGDAIEFRDIDCRDLPFERLVLMMRNYDGIPRTRLKTGSYRRKR